ncbi:MAG: hypothetical protein QXL94_01060 [Candidatus Parvarchaeum sp.]
MYEQEIYEMKADLLAMQRTLQNAISALNTRINDLERKLSAKKDEQPETKQ